jgi:hypothetical protein
MVGILTPAAAWALVAAGLGLGLYVALYLFCTLKIEIRAAQRKGADAPLPEFGELRRRLDQVERGQRGPELAAPSDVPVRPGMNLSRRSQVLSLSRRGDTPEQIASLMGLATGEVRLLLKIHHLVIQQSVRPLKPEPVSADMTISAAKAPARR